LVRLAFLVSLTSAIALQSGRAVPTAQAEERSGCNMWGCWYNGGACNQWGCYNTSYGACNQWGCSNNGACNMHGCPPGPTVGTRRSHRPPIIVQQAPVPTYREAPPPPPDYAQDSGTPADSIQVFEQAGIHFEYARALATETKSGSIGAFVSLTGPRSFSVEILRKQTTSSPAVLRSEVIDGMVEDLVSRGLHKVGSSVISADFSDGVHQGVRVRLDNRDDIRLMDAFAWRRADGNVILAIFSYKQRDADLAMRFLPTITQSLQ